MGKGRLAPSPSGRMHLGNAFSALLAWLSARAAGDSVVLRLEDLDPQRCRPEYCAGVEEDFRWLGLDWDEGGLAGGDRYRQSRRGDYYAACLARLEEKGLLYPCFCSRGELHAASAPHRSDGVFIYPGTCRDLTPEERARRAKDRAPAVRIRVPRQELRFVDGNLGPFSQRLDRDCGDFILRRSDGAYAYQLAVVADDGDMGVTQVVRGADLLDSTPRQLWLGGLLGFAPARYYHVPLLLAPDGRRLSKRDGDLDLAALSKRMTGAELVGALAWLAGLLPRPVPAAPADLVAEFSWDRVKKENITVTAALLDGSLT